MSKNISDQDKLNQIYDMVKADHEVIASLERRSKFTMYTKIFYWLLILGIFSGIFITLKPYYNGLMENKQKVEQIIQKLNALQQDLPDKQAIDLIRNILMGQ